MNGADVLSDVMDQAGVRGEIFCRTLLAPGVELTFPRGQAHFHLIRHGSVRFVDHVGDTRWTSPGDLLLLVDGVRHSISCSANPTSTAAIGQVVDDHYDADEMLLDLSEGEVAAELICGRFSLDDLGRSALAAALPQVVHIESTRQPDGRLPLLVDFIAQEATVPRPGGDLAISRLVDLVLLDAIRAWIHQQHAEPSGWLAALSDPTISRTLRAIHNDPGHPWTVTSLARVAGLSRSPLAERFTAMVGQPPMQYVTQCRMRTATRMLRAAHPVSRVALAVGYSSNSSFSRTYKRATGRSPSEVSAAGRSGPAEESPPQPATQTRHELHTSRAGIRR